MNARNDVYRPSVRDEYGRRIHKWSDIQDHMVFLHATALSYSNPRIIELGVRTGNSTSALLAAAVAMDGHLWSCDVNPPDVPADWLSYDAWSFYRGDSVSPDVLDWMPPTVDIVFIDTSHTYDQTYAELNAYVPRVRGGGVVLCHDTQFQPPNIALPSPGGPVYDALNDFCAATGNVWRNRRSDFTRRQYGLGVLHV